MSRGKTREEWGEDILSSHEELADVDCHMEVEVEAEETPVIPSSGVVDEERALQPPAIQSSDGEDEDSGDEGTSRRQPNFSNEENDTLLDKVRKVTSHLLSFQVWTPHMRLKNTSWELIAKAVSAHGTTHRTAENCKKRLRDCKRIVTAKIAAGVKTLKPWEKKVVEFFQLAVVEATSGTSAQATAPKKMTTKSKWTQLAGKRKKRRVQEEEECGEEQQPIAEITQEEPDVRHEEETHQDAAQSTASTHIGEVLQKILEEMRQNEERRRHEYQMLHDGQEQMTAQMDNLYAKQTRIQQTQITQQTLLVGMSKVLTDITAVQSQFLISLGDMKMAMEEMYQKQKEMDEKITVVQETQKSKDVYMTSEEPEPCSPLNLSTHSQHSTGTDVDHGASRDMFDVDEPEETLAEPEETPDEPEETPAKPEETPAQPEEMHTQCQEPPAEPVVQEVASVEQDKKKEEPAPQRKSKRRKMKK